MREGLKRLWIVGTVFIVAFTMFAEHNGLEIFGVNFSNFEDNPNAFLLIPQVIWWALYFVVLWIISGFNHYDEQKILPRMSSCGYVAGEKQLGF